MPGPPPNWTRVAEDIRERHAALAHTARLYRWLYHATRLVAGLSAGLLPFVVSQNAILASALSIIVVVAVVVDTVFNPKERAKSLTIACHLLYIADLKRQGRYEDFKESLDVFMNAEEARELQGIMQIVNKVEQVDQSNG